MADQFPEGVQPTDIALQRLDQQDDLDVPVFPPVEANDNDQADTRVDIPEADVPGAGGSNNNDSNYQVLNILPSRKQHTGGTEGIRRGRSLQYRKSHKRTKPLYGGTLRLRDPEHLLNDLDFVDAPSEIQAKNVRDVNTGLHRKKEFLDKLHTQPRQSARIGCCQKTAWSLSLSWTHFKQRLAEARNIFELWGGHIKTIEGHFGSGVASYFIFLKGLFYLNIAVFVLLLAFITIPQVMYRYMQQEPPGYIHNASFTGRELLTGGGWFHGTELYYGYHLNGIIEIFTDVKYNMKYAYVLGCGAYYLLNVIILARLLSLAYRHHYIEESGLAHTVSIVKVFCAWDYKINEEHAATLQHTMLYKDFQKFVAGFAREETAITFCRMTGLILLRIILNLVFLGLLCGAGYLVWYISVTQSLNNDLDILKDLAMPLCITAINFILPFAFSILGTFEQYSNPRIELRLTMLRSIMLNMVTIGVLLYFWYNSLECHTATAGTHEWTVSNVHCKPCWENFMGEQIYRLVIMDFLFLLLFTFISEFIRRLLSQFCCKSLGPPGFNIGRNTLSLIYSQMLIWLGSFYSPLLSVISILKFFIIFYVKRVSVLQNCAPSAKPWRTGQTYTFVLLLLFAAFITCFIAVAYGVVFIRPSEVCGPYQGYNSTYDVIYDMLDTWEDTSSQHIIKSFIEIVTSVGFLAFVLIGIGVAAYYCRAVAHAHKEMVHRLRNQIIIEGKDKKFLLVLLQEAMGHGGRAESTGTWESTRSDSLHRYPDARPSSSGASAVRKRTTAAVHMSLTPPREHDHFVQTPNKSYLDRSLSERESALPSMNPDYRDRSLGTDPGQLEITPARPPRPESAHLEAQNPMYREHSPNRKPALPYPEPYPDKTSRRSGVDA